MRILILHHNRYYKVRYDLAIDHNVHQVCYAATPEYLAQIPTGLRYETLVLDPAKPVKEQAQAWLRTQALYDRILTRQENLLMTAAELREEFAIPGMRPAAMILFRDKVKMKDAIRAANLRAPRYCPVTPAAAPPWTGATILKPRDGAGSQGVQRFPTARQALAQIAAATAGAPDHPYFTHYELEEFIEGPIWHVDGYLFAGEPVIIKTSKYIGACLDYEAGAALGSIQVDHPGLADWALQCLAALGAQTLTFHLEAFLTPEGPVFLEVAGRAGGGDIVEVVERATGVHLHVLDMASDVHGQAANRFAGRQPSDRKYGFFLVPGHQLNGLPCRVTGVESLLQDPVVEHYRLSPPGSPTRKKSTYQAHDAPLSGIVSDPDPDRLERWMRRLFASVRVVPATARTGATPAVADTDK